MAVTGEAEGVPEDKAAALGVASGIEAGDDPALHVEHLGLLVGLKAAHHHKAQAHAHALCVEGAVLHGPEVLGLLGKVGVGGGVLRVEALGGSAQLVVMLDRSQGSFDVHAIDGLEQLLKRVALKDATVARACIPVREGGGEGVHTLGRLFLKVRIANHEALMPGHWRWVGTATTSSLTLTSRGTPPQCWPP